LDATISENARLRPVRLWLGLLCLMIAAMVLVGGATRLTESGLSIVEWKPVTGALPPLTDAAWHAAFDAYKAIPQYRELNAGMSLSEFKAIFWWEWSHRLLGRAIGVVFLLPFLFFLWRGVLDDNLKKRLWLILGLGALQGAVGWWMVASGLTHRVEVSQYRLAVHLMLALVIFSAILWTLLRSWSSQRQAALPSLRAGALVVLAVTALQIYFGAIVAGLRAGRVYNTWPLIDGAFIPAPGRLFFESPWWLNLFENALTAQFAHRMTAYALLGVAAFYAASCFAANTPRLIRRLAALFLVAVGAQAAIGIVTLLQQVPIGTALLHQAGALVVLSLAIVQLDRLTPKRIAAPQLALADAPAH
jgi:cytochrome c oxidase assembly protein subunit 15